LYIKDIFKLQPEAGFMKVETYYFN